MNGGFKPEAPFVTFLPSLLSPSAVEAVAAANRVGLTFCVVNVLSVAMFNVVLGTTAGKPVV